MPKTYYAVTRKIPAGTIQSVKTKHFQEMEDVITYKKYYYDDLIEAVSGDKNLKLYASKEIAMRNSPQEEKIENEESREIGLVDVVAAYAFPILSAASFVAKVLSGPNQIRNVYQSIILKITILDESCILPPEERQPGQDCLGVLPSLRLRKRSHRTHAYSSHDWNVRFSADSNCYIQDIHFRDTHYSQLSPRYPSKYGKIIEAPANNMVSQVVNFLNDYHAPKLGLFLTGHWNRGHLLEAKTLAALIKNTDGPTQALNILWRKREELEQSGKCNLEGSFFKRITYAIELLAPKMHAARSRSLPR